MKVSTNINTASRDELMQLIGVNSTIAGNIIRERDRSSFTDIHQLRDRNLMTSSVFEQNRPFMSVGDRERIVAADPNFIVNLNTASASDLQRAGLTSAQASAVVDSRGNGYTFKSLGEIQALPRVTISDRRLHEIADNIRIGYYWLDAWHWGDSDFSSGWGHYFEGQEIYRPRPSFININTATRDELWSVGFSEGQVNHLLGRRGRMNSPRDIPFNVAEFDHAITLSTNVNTATAQEWMSLSTGMSRSFAEELAAETEFQPFGTIREVQDFFYDNDYHAVFRQIRNFIVLR
jgi:DNA uptake protein ComE-like DNA-binding protein